MLHRMLLYRWSDSSGIWPCDIPLSTRFRSEHKFWRSKIDNQCQNSSKIIKIGQKNWTLWDTIFQDKILDFLKQSQVEKWVSWTHFWSFRVERGLYIGYRHLSHIVRMFLVVIPASGTVFRLTLDQLVRKNDHSRAVFYSGIFDWGDFLSRNPILDDWKWLYWVSETQIETSCDRNGPKLSSVDQKVFVIVIWLFSGSEFLFLRNRFMDTVFYVRLIVCFMGTVSGWLNDSFALIKW